MIVLIINGISIRSLNFGFHSWDELLPNLRTFIVKKLEWSHWPSNG
jgi:hypothetical protein